MANENVSSGKRSRSSTSLRVEPTGELWVEPTGELSVEPTSEPRVEPTGELSVQSKIEPENPSALKHLFDISLMKKMAKSLKAAGAEFDSAAFLKDADLILNLEMKNRVRFIRDRLRLALPLDYERALSLLLKCLIRSPNGISGFGLWPLSEFVQTYGVEHLKSRFTKKALKFSLDALRELTPLFSSEFAVRPFLQSYEKETLAYLLLLTKSSSRDLRRWASEGSRPRLPWGERLGEFVRHPQKTSLILDQLKFDVDLYVRKSVANHLNDIAKDHPDHVIQTLMRWKKHAKKDSDQRCIAWIARHALRTLVKQGSSRALAVIGISKAEKVAIRAFSLEPRRVKIGKSFELSFDLHSSHVESQRLVVDYIVHFARANGRQNQKVFKLKSFSIDANSKISLKKTHSMKPITTRNYHPGKHRVEIQVNGAVMARGELELSR